MDEELTQHGAEQGADRLPDGRLLPGHSVGRDTRWQPGGASPNPSGRPKIPFPGREVDHAIACDLMRDPDEPFAAARTRLEAVARRLVDDALAGKPHAIKLIVERTQPPMDGDESGGTVIVTQVSGPSGPMEPTTIHELTAHGIASGPDDDDDTDP